MYARLPSEKELAGTGFTQADYEETAEVWPENWPAFVIFSTMQSQWDVGMGGPAGLKYQVLFEIMDRKGLANDDWWEMFADIQSMEAAALKEMNK
jgi:hypothetical protein